MIIGSDWDSDVVDDEEDDTTSKSDSRDGKGKSAWYNTFDIKYLNRRAQCSGRVRNVRATRSLH